MEHFTLLYNIQLVSNLSKTESNLPSNVSILFCPSQPALVSVCTCVVSNLILNELGLCASTELFKQIEVKVNKMEESPHKASQGNLLFTLI